MNCNWIFLSFWQKLILILYRLVMFSFLALVLLGQKIGSGIHMDRDQILLFFVINLLSFYRALPIGSTSLRAEYQMTNVFCFISRVMFMVSRCTLFTAFSIIVSPEIWLVLGTFLSWTYPREGVIYLLVQNFLKMLLKISYNFYKNFEK